ncbi:CheR family methyltransferase [Rhodoferax aquaticus]|uniref:Chemotaxis protein methyltransferase n=1 Tax=Rhodoferax aquaticus TaxID=2527691 RepID=A0A515EK53_9BURK|nr:protein-glutamate O-methyltransferase CheR [Rhodoferax aquaticus]QDL53044.1 protein-glutamate O-methyltransferase CheR [Rhodoferax aquaticus]
MAAITFSDAQFKTIGDIMYEAVGLSYSDSKKSLIQSRLAPRIQRLGLEGFADYIAILQDETQASEFQMAVDLLTTNETYFFREPKHYELLEAELSARKSKEPLSIWSAASSFGDEAYSTAMLLSDMQISGKIGPEWSILGTDISHRVLLSAKEGVYPQDRLRDVSADRLRRYCLRGEGESEGQSMVHEKIRSRVQFGQLNLCKPFEGLGPFDVVFLRNVLIYFDAPTKRDVVDRVLQTLKPGGLFFLGTAEGRAQCDTPLITVQPGAFRKVA